MHTFSHIHTHTCTHFHKCKHTLTYLHILIHTHTHICTHANTYTQTCTHSHTYTHKLICTHPHIYSHMHTYTSTLPLAYLQRYKGKNLHCWTRPHDLRSALISTRLGLCQLKQTPEPCIAPSSRVGGSSFPQTAGPIWYLMWNRCLVKVVFLFLLLKVSHSPRLPLWSLHPWLELLRTGFFMC